MNSDYLDMIMQDLKDTLNKWPYFMDPLKFLMFIDLLEIDKEVAKLNVVDTIEVKDRHVILTICNMTNPNLKLFISPNIRSLDVQIAHVIIKYFQPSNISFKMKSGKWHIKKEK